MPARSSRTATPFPPSAGAVKPKGKMKARTGAVRRAAKSALLAAALAIAQADDETTSKWRLFDPGLLDRLRAPVTRYHE